MRMLTWGRVESGMTQFACQSCGTLVHFDALAYQSRAHIERRNLCADCARKIRQRVYEERARLARIALAFDLADIARLQERNDIRRGYQWKPSDRDRAEQSLCLAALMDSISFSESDWNRHCDANAGRIIHGYRP